MNGTLRLSKRVIPLRSPDHTCAGRDTKTQTDGRVIKDHPAISVLEITVSNEYYGQSRLTPALQPYLQLKAICKAQYRWLLMHEAAPEKSDAGQSQGTEHRQMELETI